MRYLYQIAVVFLVLLLTACVSFASIRDNFEEEGYEYSTDASTWINNVLNHFEEEDVDVESHVFVNGFDVAIVLEFNSSAEMQEQIEKNEDLQEFIGELEEKQLIRNNFLLVPISFNSDTKESMIEIFNR